MINLAALRKLIVNGKWLIALLFSLFSIHYSLFTPAAQAAAPTPLPCQNAIYDETLLTDNWLVDENKNPPQGLLFTFGASGEPGTPIDVYGEKNFQVDFSQLSALFGPTNSNFNEGNYQDTAHRNANTSELNQEEINKYHGPIQKTEGRAVLDELRKKYVEYVKLHPSLAESAKTFSDPNGNDPKTISDLIDAYGDNPQPTRSGDNNQAWQDGWGKYWDKIPTAYNEFYEGRIIFKIAEGIPRIQAAKDGTICPRDLSREITFVMPELFRTAAVTGQMNMTLVPKSAQSQESNNLILGQNTQEPKTVLGKIINTCLKAIANNPLSTSLKKIIKVSSKLFNPDNVYAANPPGCIKALTPGKEGQDPYCALPEGQLNERDGENCRNQEDSFKVDTLNPNVICNFNIHWRHQNSPLPIGSKGAGAWDSCEPHPTIPGYLRCQVQIAIWPVFRIPWTSQTWNNTLYADDTEPGTASQGNPALGPIKGRPGVYSFFTPRVVFEDEIDALLRKCDVTAENALSNPACQELLNIASENREAQPTFAACVEDSFITNPNAVLNCVENIVASLEKKKPGEEDQISEDDPSRRFIGSTDCSKEFVKASLTDKGVHPQLGLDFGAGNTCNLQAANQRSDDNDHAPGKPPRGSPPGGNVECNRAGIEFNGEPYDIQNYIACYAEGKTEPITHLDLKTVMLGTLSKESGGGNTCAVGGLGEIGVFQYMATTWQGTSAAQAVRSGGYSGEEGSVARDSGSSAMGYPDYGPGQHGRGVCWEKPGFDNPSYSQVFGTDIDDGAWDPYLQVRMTNDMILNTSGNAACNWTGFAAWVFETEGYNPCPNIPLFYLL